MLEDPGRAIRGNRPPETSFERVLVRQQITDAMYTAAECGCAVEVN